MNVPTGPMRRITAEIDAETLALAAEVARVRGQTLDTFATEAIERAARAEADHLAFLAEGKAAIERGDYLTHEELVADIAQWKRDRKNAA